MALGYTIFNLSPIVQFIGQFFGLLSGVPYRPTYTSTMTIDVTQGVTCEVITTSAVGNATLNASSGGTFGQNLVVLIANDSGGARTITFGTNFRPTGTVVGTGSKTISVEFQSNGVSFFETGRSTAV